MTIVHHLQVLQHQATQEWTAPGHAADIATCGTVRCKRSSCTGNNNHAPAQHKEYPKPAASCSSHTPTKSLPCRTIPAPSNQQHSYTQLRPTPHSNTNPSYINPTSRPSIAVHPRQPGTCPAACQPGQATQNARASWCPALVHPSSQGTLAPRHHQTRQGLPASPSPAPAPPPQSRCCRGSGCSSPGQTL
jgi:hypothetical protein